MPKCFINCLMMHRVLYKWAELQVQLKKKIVLFSKIIHVLVLNSPAIHNRLSVRKANPKIPVTILPSTSNTSQSKSMTRRRLHIEPINMSELQETGENNVSTIVAEISEQPEQDSTLREGSDYNHCPIAPKKQHILF
jgi:hypothetical protein